MEEIGMKKYVYEIYLDSLAQGNLVGTNGDIEFDTEAEAQADADDYIISSLSEEYGKPVRDFRVKIYEIEE
jgi:hypothetical protein